MAAMHMRHAAVLAELQHQLPDISFQPGITHAWSPEQQIIHYIPSSQPTCIAQLLHEAAHAALNHRDYGRDVELIDREREAWTYAISHFGPTLAPWLHNDHPIVQDALDSYRDWLHARSQCPRCSAVGIESDNAYQCLACQQRWQPNEARTCQLRRRRLN